MRKIISCIFILVMILVLCSCSNGEITTEKTKKAEIKSSDITFEITDDANNLEEPYLTYTIANNSTDKNISLGEICTLEKEVNGEWKEVPLSNATYYATGYTLYPSKAFDGACVVYDDEHPLETGKYRICKEIDVFNINTEPTEIEANVEGGTITIYGHDPSSINTINIYAEFNVK